jgi:hypothetical protein
MSSDSECEMSEEETLRAITKKKGCIAMRHLKTIHNRTVVYQELL